MKRRSIWLCIGLVLTLTLQPFLAFAETGPSIALGIESKEQPVGQEIEVTVHGKDLEDLFGYEIRLKYDASRLQFKRASALWPGMSVPAKDQEGTVMFAHTKLGKNSEGENGSADLAVFTFIGLAEGAATIDVERVKLVNSKAEAVTLNTGEGFALALGASKQAVVFQDIQNHWAKEAIERAVTLGVVSGYPDGTFKPDGEVTRAEFTSMLMRGVTLPEASATPVTFNDYSSIPEWARPFVSSAVTAGVISGYEDGTFRSDRQITRAEMAVMIAKAASLSLAGEGRTGFADHELIPDWAISSVAASVEAGLIQGKGDNRFEPMSQATRAEAVTMILRLMDRDD